MATLNRPLTGIGWDQPADLSNKDVVKRLSPSAVKGILENRRALGVARRRCQAIARRHVEWRILRAEENRFEIA